MERCENNSAKDKLKMSDKVILFREKKECCGCGACMNICPKQAITMQEDDYGFIYPSIDHIKCVHCGMCKKVCTYQSEFEKRDVISTYVAAAKEDDILKGSASGGVFAAIAVEVLKKNGAVFGCSMENNEEIITPKHVRITKIEELIKLQGSKYVQSFIGDTYKLVKKELETGRMVLFSGTPCQVDGLLGFLGKDYENLLAVDIICHGVPSANLFQAYIRNFEKKLRGKIVDFKFRDKTKGWGLRGRVIYRDKSGKLKSRLFPSELSSYFKLFLKADIYRENCYSCKYACEHRPGDLTIGDYWGIRKEHPEYLAANGGYYDVKKGVSCILASTEKGQKFLKELGTGIHMEISEFHKAAEHNEQLKRPSSEGTSREMIFKMYAKGGYEAVEKWYCKSMGIKRYYLLAWNSIPESGQKFIKKTLRR